MALIYIVEDDENIREIEAIALKNSGHMLYECGDARSFFKAMSENAPTLHWLTSCCRMRTDMR